MAATSKYLGPVCTPIGQHDQLKFVAVGPQRTATSWLYKMLQQHPIVALPRMVKETMFFDQYFDKGLNWYFSHFQAAPGQTMGEVAPTYFGSEAATLRLKRLWPDLSVIVSVRNPIQRAHSLFRHHLSKGRVPNCFQTAVDQMPEILETGRYSIHAKRWETEFRKTEYVLNEDISSGPEKTLSRVLRFLELPEVPGFQDASVRVNSATAPRNRPVALLCSRLSTRLRAMRLHRIVEIGKSMGLKRVYSGGRPVKGLSQAEHDWLVNYYSDDIEWLEERLDRSFGLWRKYASRMNGDH